MQDFEALKAAIIKFRDDREWKQFHNPKDCALSLMLEAAEVTEHFQWKDKDEMEKYIAEHKSEVAEELSDVLYWVILMSHDLDIDILNASFAKLKKNNDKYPVEKARGSHSKYTEL